MSNNLPDNHLRISLALPLHKYHIAKLVVSLPIKNFVIKPQSTFLARYLCCWHASLNPVLSNGLVNPHGCSSQLDPHRQQLLQTNQMQMRSFGFDQLTLPRMRNASVVWADQTEH